jgi:hypothetical protein
MLASSLKFLPDGNGRRRNNTTPRIIIERLYYVRQKAHVEQRELDVVPQE